MTVYYAFTERVEEEVIYELYKIIGKWYNLMEISFEKRENVYMYLVTEERINENVDVLIRAYESGGYEDLYYFVETYLYDEDKLLLPNFRYKREYSIVFPSIVYHEFEFIREAVSGTRTYCICFDYNYNKKEIERVSISKDYRRERIFKSDECGLHRIEDLKRFRDLYELWCWLEKQIEE